jgi:hypothetical protein
MVAYTSRSAEDAAERAAEYDRLGLMVSGTLAVGFEAYDRTFNLIHPNRDEQLAIIRNISGKEES